MIPWLTELAKWMGVAGVAWCLAELAWRWVTGRLG